MTHDDVTKMSTIEDRHLYGLHVYTKFHKNWNLFNGKSDRQKNPVQNLWDFSDKKKKKSEKKSEQTERLFRMNLRKSQEEEKKKSEQKQ